MRTRREGRSVPGRDAEHVAVADLMCRDVICVRPEMSVIALVDLTLARDLAFAPVVDARGRVVGVVTTDDLARATWDSHVIGRARTVEDIMTPFAFTLARSATIGRAAALMAYEGVNRIVIVEPSGAVAGVVSGVDVMRWLARQAGYVVPGPGPSAPALASDAAPPNLVMVVDDDATTREELAEILREEGYEVVTAANGKDALRALRAGQRPGLILLDLAMPVMDGDAFASELRRDPGLVELPVVLLSGQSAAREIATRVEARACLVKPVTYPALLDTVERFCAA
jgi:CheY-like chemotaxis protein/predicted transcriptional regulator